MTKIKKYTKTKLKRIWKNKQQKKTKNKYNSQKSIKQIKNKKHKRYLNQLFVTWCFTLTWGTLVPCGRWLLQNRWNFGVPAVLSTFSGKHHSLSATLNKMVKTEERGRRREREIWWLSMYLCVCVCAIEEYGLCVIERARERESC